MACADCSSESAGVSEALISQMAVLWLGPSPCSTSVPSKPSIGLAWQRQPNTDHFPAVLRRVEDEVQLSFLREHECDEFQGYYFSRPLHVRDVAIALRKPLILNPVESLVSPVA